MSLAVLTLLLAAGAGSPSAAPVDRVAVVVELFTSEGCSSCPPADELLRDLDARQPVSGVQVIALELHVDYWNRLGWTDPFSQAAFSDRQRAAARRLDDGPYTPQAIVDGTASLVGSDRGKVLAAVRAAASTSKLLLTLRAESAGEDAIVLRAQAPPEAVRRGTTIVLGLAERGLSTDVPRGENAHRHLEHAPVVRTLVERELAADGVEVRLSREATWDADRLLAFAFVQSGRRRAVTAAAVAPVTAGR